MTFSDTAMVELGITLSTNIHNTRSLIRTLKYVLDILQTEEAFTVEEHKHTHAHTHTHTHTYTHTDIISNLNLLHFRCHMPINRSCDKSKCDKICDVDAINKQTRKSTNF